MSNPGYGSVEETPLSHACARGFLDIVMLLVEKADVNRLCSVREAVEATYI